MAQLPYDPSKISRELSRHYIPASEADIQAMFQAVGSAKFSDMYRHIADDVMVMYLGRAVEQGTRDAIFNTPQHPYTKALLAAALIPDPALERARKRVRLAGEPASPLDPLAGLQFLRSRLPVGEQDPIYVPQLRQIQPGHLVAEYDPI